MQTIAVVGSESFLAKNLITYLAKFAGAFRLKCYDYLPDSAAPNYEQIDFTKTESLKKIDFSAERIVFFTGKTGTLKGFAEYKKFVEVNELYLLNFLQAYVEAKSAARIIYPSSRLIFKPNVEKPVAENSPLEFKSVYAVNKYAAEQYLAVYGKNFAVDYVILRICTPYGSLIDSDGSYGTFEIFNKQAKQNGKVTIFGDGEQKKTYTDIRDVCEAFYRLIKAEKVKHDSYNLGGQDLSMNEAVAQIVAMNKAKTEHVPWPKEYLNVDGGSVFFDSGRFDEEFQMTYHPIV